MGQVAAEENVVSKYPHGRWRLVDPAELDHVVLWATHILIRHRDVRNADPAFALADWHSQSPGGERSRVEALALALDLREQATRHPERFAELALEYSEDVATRSLGGSLGGISASQLIFWGSVLDALAATRPGQISEVVETAYGFHILQRRAPPKENTVSGAHIVISHNDAGWIKVLGRGERPARSRVEALALATSLHQRAASKPEEFSKLVELYSEHRDASRGGDMGSWSTLEPTFYPREVELLAGLAIGEVAPPLDSPVGFQIIQRTPNRRREHYAMEHVRLYFEPDPAASGDSSRVAVLAKATELANSLRKNPLKFTELQRIHCCTYVEEWIDGRGSPLLTTELSQLSVGEVAHEPVQSEFSYVIAKRVAASAHMVVATQYNLPEPKVPDIRAFVGPRGETFLREQIKRVGEVALADLHLPEAVAREVAQLHDGAGRFEGLQTAVLRLEAFDRLLERMRAILGPGIYPRYQRLLEAHFEHILLEGN